MSRVYSLSRANLDPWNSSGDSVSPLPLPPFHSPSVCQEEDTALCVIENRTTDASVIHNIGAHLVASFSCDGSRRQLPLW